MPIEEIRILNTSATLFTQWLATYTSNILYQSFPTGTGRIALQPIRNPGGSISSPIRLGMDSFYITAKKETEEFERIEQVIVFQLIPLSDERVEIHAECSQQVVLMYFKELLAAIEQRWPQQESAASNTAQRSSSVPFTLLRDDERPIQVSLRFSPTPKGANITWESDFGSSKSRFIFPYKNDRLSLVIKALDAAQHPAHPVYGSQFTTDEQRVLEELGLWIQGRVPVEAHQIVGRKLFSALTRDKKGSEALKVVREAARHQGRSISYILRFLQDGVELAALPWEALWDDRQAVLLSRGNREIDSCERYLDINEALSPPLPSGKKLHILALSPEVGIPESIRNEERVARLKSWEALKKKGLLEWDELSPLTIMQLDDWMRRGPTPDIIHYYGHGIYQGGQGYLLFDSPSMSGKYELISANRLTAILGGIRLIMVHACQSAMVDGAENRCGLLTGIAPALSVVSEAVVAMQLTVRIHAATRFSEVFYEELVRGRSLQSAVAAARRSLYVMEPDSASWYVPTLYIRTRELRPIYFFSKGEN